MFVERQALFVVGLRSASWLPAHLTKEIAALARRLYTVATVRPDDKLLTLEEERLGWKSGWDIGLAVPSHRIFVRTGYLPPDGAVSHLRSLQVEQVLVCGSEADACCLATGFALADAGFRPSLLKWLTMGSPLDRSASVTGGLWRQHVGRVLHCPGELSLG